MAVEIVADFLLLFPNFFNQMTNSRSVENLHMKVHDERTRRWRDAIINQRVNPGGGTASNQLHSQTFQHYTHIFTRILLHLMHDDANSDSPPQVHPRDDSLDSAHLHSMLERPDVHEDAGVVPFACMLRFFEGASTFRSAAPHKSTAISTQGKRSRSDSFDGPGQRPSWPRLNRHQAVTDELIWHLVHEEHHLQDPRHMPMLPPKQQDLVYRYLQYDEFTEIFPVPRNKSADPYGQPQELLAHFWKWKHGLECPVPWILREQDLAHVVPGTPIAYVVPDTPIPDVVPDAPIPRVAPGTPIAHVTPDTPIAVLVPADPKKHAALLTELKAQPLLTNVVFVGMPGLVELGAGFSASMHFKHVTFILPHVTAIQGECV